MTDEPVRVDLPVLRAAAGGLADEAYTLARGLAGHPGLVLSAPGWRAGAALAGLESAVHAWHGVLGVRVAETGAALRAAAEAYAAADDRAAGRLAGRPR
ncbi:hypothetical protein TPA0907_62820 [Micromonospora humidisoli]|uniref:hypothetical protein n=1 Tax=Micromonospora sp. AKA109 TaxID=2733865 RepID=UPI0022C2D837|nr:hypothetical protein [Micromonospora sp. AKA109]GHJ11915.1 hypothetical protein TPA0907_62820 [Micromonospora sp. AKA109]